MSNSKKISVMNKNVTVWQVAILQIVFLVITNLLVFGLNRNASGADKTKERIEQLDQKKADKDYVNQQDNLIREDIKIVKTDMEKTVFLIRDDLKEIRSYILTTKK